MKIYFCIIKRNENQDQSQEEIERRRNELLDVYSLYLRTGIEAIKEEVIIKAYELHLSDPNFTFVL